MDKKYKVKLDIDTDCYALMDIAKNVEKIQEKFNELNNKIETMKIDNNLKILPVSKGTWGTRTHVKNHKSPESAKIYIDNLYNENFKIYESNNINIKNNQIVYDNVITLLTELGLSKTKFDKKFKSVSCDWYVELGSLIPTINPLRQLEDDYNRYNECISDWIKEINKTQHELDKIREKDKKKRELTLLIAKIAITYNIEINDLNMNDTIDFLIEKNKYLKLAHFLSLNRGDWTDGCNYAERGISGFMVETEEDKLIYNEISEMIENWENYMDGRCFRDCIYNYDYLYKKVEESDKVLYDFYMSLQNYIWE